jgi:hypothetical protein
MDGLVGRARPGVGAGAGVRLTRGGVKHDGARPKLIQLKAHLFDLLWTCGGFAVDLLYSFTTCCGLFDVFVDLFDESTTNLQHLDVSKCCG